MESINKLIERLKAHAEAWEVSETDNRDELIGEQAMAFDCLMAAEALEKIDLLDKFWKAINKM
jgi:hypothetical protein